MRLSLVTFYIYSLHCLNVQLCDYGSLFIIESLCLTYPPPLSASLKDPKHRRSSQEVSRHHRSSEASGAGGCPLQRGIWEVASRGGEANGCAEGRWDGQIVQGEENCRFWEVRVKNSVTFISITRHHLGVLREQCPSKWPDLCKISIHS